MSILNRTGWAPGAGDPAPKAKEAEETPTNREAKELNVESIVPKDATIQTPKHQLMGRPRATHLVRNNYVSVALTDDELKVLVDAKNTYEQSNLGQLLRYAIFRGLGLVRPHPEKVNADWGPTKKKSKGK